MAQLRHDSPSCEMSQVNDAGRTSAPDEDILPAAIGQSRVEDAVQRCRANGWRLTPIRRRTLELVSLSARPFKAYELLDRIGDEHVIASPMRVYRALEFLTGHGFVRHLKTINAFIWCASPQFMNDIPFVICDHCESAVALFDQDVCAMIVERAAWQGFEADLSTMELHGLCSICAEKNIR